MYLRWQSTLYQLKSLIVPLRLSYSAGKNVEENIEFTIKSPDGKALELMPLSDQCEVCSKAL